MLSCAPLAWVKTPGGVLHHDDIGELRCGVAVDGERSTISHSRGSWVGGLVMSCPPPLSANVPRHGR
jgi:hypothetical protein